MCAAEYHTDSNVLDPLDFAEIKVRWMYTQMHWHPSTDVAPSLNFKIAERHFEQSISWRFFLSADKYKNFSNIKTPNTINPSTACLVLCLSARQFRKKNGVYTLNSAFKALSNIYSLSTSEVVAF